MLTFALFYMKVLTPPDPSDIPFKEHFFSNQFEEKPTHFQTPPPLNIAVLDFNMQFVPALSFILLAAWSAAVAIPIADGVTISVVRSLYSITFALALR